MPDFKFEKQASRKGAQVVCGVDEAGRGPWAGPVVAGAVVLNGGGVTKALLKQLDDSKKLKRARREDIFEELREQAIVGVGIASVGEIDQLNILRATFLAMKRAVRALDPEPDYALVDGNRLPGLDCETECIVKGDGLSLSIAAASIIAKVTRDRIMDKLDMKYPGYGWSTNAGYGTAAHRAAMQDLGVTPEHRRSFEPVRKILSSKRA